MNTEQRITDAMAVLDLIEKRTVRDCQTHEPFAKMSREDKNQFMAFRISQVVAIYCAQYQPPELVISGVADSTLNIPRGQMQMPDVHNFMARSIGGDVCKHCGEPMMDAGHYEFWEPSTQR